MMTLVTAILDAFKSMGANDVQLAEEENRLMTDDEYFLDCVETYCKGRENNEQIH